MANQEYLMINESTNIVDNVCIWNGDVNTWQPPAGFLMLVLATTPAMVWELNTDKTDYVLTEKLGAAGVGFTWNGTVCITDDPKPDPNVQTSGTQTL